MAWDHIRVRDKNDVSISIKYEYGHDGVPYLEGLVTAASLHQWRHRTDFVTPNQGRWFLVIPGSVRMASPWSSHSYMHPPRLR